MTKYIKDAWLVIVLGLAFGAALAGVQMKLGPVIDQNKLDEALRRIPALVPGSATPDLKKVSRDDVMLQVAGTTAYYARSGEGKLLGWVVQASGQGFADRIELLVGVDAEVRTITGLYVLEHKESPGYGDRITTPEFQAQFNQGKPGPDGTPQRLTAEQPIQVTREPESGNQKITALTGATISSVSVAEIINAALAKVRQGLREQASPAARPPAVEAEQGGR